MQIYESKKQTEKLPLNRHNSISNRWLLRKQIAVELHSSSPQHNSTPHFPQWVYLLNSLCKRRNSIQLIAPHQSPAVWFLLLTANRWRVIFAAFNPETFSSAPSFFLLSLPFLPPSFCTRKWTEKLPDSIIDFSPHSVSLPCNGFAFFLARFFNNRKFDDFHFALCFARELLGVVVVKRKEKASKKFAVWNSKIFFAFCSSTIGWEWKESFRIAVCFAYLHFSVIKKTHSFEAQFSKWKA